jgi:hypothetical protein
MDRRHVLDRVRAAVRERDQMIRLISGRHAAYVAHCVVARQDESGALLLA